MTAKTVRAVLPNAGVEADYLADLRRMIDAMHMDVNREITRAYRERPPHAARTASDESPAARMRRVMARLTQKWTREFNRKAPDHAQEFADEAKRHADFAFKRHLSSAGLSVQFKPTRAMNDAYQAVIGENVGLIRSIPQQYLSQVQGIVMRAVQKGSDLQELTEVLEGRYQVTRSRAELIARDQNAKANSVMNRARQRELGIQRAIWRHTPSSVNPRESHLDADGTEYDLQQGCLIDGELIFPGELINCGCVSESVIPGLPSLDEE